MTERADLLPVIPIVDIRADGTTGHARAHPERVRGLRDDCLAIFPRGTARALPLLDGLARRWLLRSRAPYVGEIEAIAAALGISGVWFLNGSYQWGCTSLAREEAGVPWLARTLDWPFHGLGRRVEIARMRGEAGDYFSVTWPGYVGVLTGMAPGRFAACVNQAPLRRRTRHRWLRGYDMAANALHTWRVVRHMPPDQLLRQVFETCADFAEAKAMLERVAVARPVIFTLAGCRPGEHCVIERREEGFRTRADSSVAANDWHTVEPGWEARIGGQHFFKLSCAEAAANSRARADALAAWPTPVSDGAFDWVTPPVLNVYTRVAVIACPARGELRVQGYELADGGNLPVRATRTQVVAGAADALSGPEEYVHTATPVS